MNEIISATLPSFQQLSLDLNSERMIDSPVELWKRYGHLVCTNRENSRKLGWLGTTAGYKGAEEYRDNPSRFYEVQDYMRTEGRIYEAKLEHVLFYGICISTDAGFHGQRYKNASAAAQILQPLFDQGIPARTVFDAIVEAKGLKGLDIDRLLTLERKVRIFMPWQRKAGTVTGDDARVAVHLHTPSPSGGAVEQPSTEMVRYRSGPVRYPARPPQKVNFREKRLHCRLGMMRQADADRLQNMQVGECASLIVECQEAPNGRKNIKVTEIFDA